MCTPKPHHLGTEPSFNFFQVRNDILEILPVCTPKPHHLGREPSFNFFQVRNDILEFLPVCTPKPHHLSTEPPFLVFQVRNDILEILPVCTPKPHHLGTEPPFLFFQVRNDILETHLAQFLRPPPLPPEYLGAVASAYCCVLLHAYRLSTFTLISLSHNLSIIPTPETSNFRHLSATYNSQFTPRL